MRSSITRTAIGVVVAIALVGCGGEPEQAGTRTAPSDAATPAEDADDTDDTEPGGPASDGADDPDDGTEEADVDAAAGDDAAGDGAEDADDDAGTSLRSGGADPAFEPRSLDLFERHPMGVVVELHELDFDGHNILLDVDITNGSNQRIVITTASFASERLRLLDDLGGVYELNASDEERETINSISSGDSVGGTIAFRGPIDRQASELRLLVNVYDYDLEDDEAVPNSAGLFPKLILGPIELGSDA